MNIYSFLIFYRMNLNYRYFNSFLKKAFSEISDILMQITTFLTVLAMFEI